jgi:hypothetical protein
MPIKLVSISKKRSKYNDLINANIDKIASLYDEGLSLRTISHKLGVGGAALEKLFRLNDIKPRDQGFYARTRTLVDEHYFDVIDTEEKAYILGLIYADGNNYKKQYRIAIKLLRKDRDLLAKISNIIYGEDHLEDLKVRKNGKTYRYTALRIYSKHISEVMEKHGVVPRKSLILTFPRWLDEKLYPHFIRGMIDGDGSIYLNEKKNPGTQVYTSLIGTANVNNFIAAYLLKRLGVKIYKRPVKNKSRRKFYTLVIQGAARSLCFLDWIYQDSSIFLDRKHDRYLRLKEEYRHNNKMKRSEFYYASE